MNTELFIYHYSFDEYGEGTIFADNTGKILLVVDANDGDRRGKYFNPVLSQIGVKVYETNNSSDIVKSNLTEYLGF